MLERLCSPRSVLSIRLLAACLLAAILLSCSSAPKKTDVVLEKKNLAAEYTEFGNSYFNQGNYNQALEFFVLALSANISVDNEEGIAQSQNSIGKVLVAIGELDLAEQKFSQSLDLAYKIDSPLLIIQSANNLGEVHMQRGDLQKAVSLFQEALKQINDPGRGPSGKEDKRGEGAIVFHNLGSAYKKLNELDKALEFLGNAVEINLELKRFEELASNYYMIASIHSKNGDYETALNYANLALQNDKIVENSLGIGKDLYALGAIKAKAGQHEQAYDFFYKSYQVYQALTVYREILKILPHLILAAENTGRDEEAEQYRSLYGEYQENQ